VKDSDIFVGEMNMVSNEQRVEGKTVVSAEPLRGGISHPWTEAATRPQRPEIDFLRKELGLTEPQVKILNWLALVAGERFVFHNGKYRESSFLNVVVPPPLEEYLPLVMVSLGFERVSASPWSNEWRGTFRDECPVASLRPDKGEIDIRRLPYKAPQGRGRERDLEPQS
jgi:hypothetical protein